MRKVVLWIVVGLVVTWASLFGYFKVQHLMNPYVPFDPFSGAKVDLERSPDDSGITYVLSEQTIGDTEFIAQIAGSRKDGKRGPSWDYYFFGVSRLSNINGIERRHPFFDRCYKVSFFPPEFDSSTFENILFFDVDKQVVSFDLGFTNITCKLPNLSKGSSGKGSAEGVTHYRFRSNTK